MLKSSVIALCVILVANPLYGYTITIKEKLIGILQKTTVIRNVKYIDIDAGYVHVEIKEKGQVFQYSFPCSQVVQIAEDNGENIPLLPRTYIQALQQTLYIHIARSIP